MKLITLAESLKTAFGVRVGIELLENELKLTIADKTAYIGSDGRLSGESRVGAAGLEVGVNISGGIATPSAAVTTSV
jgi:hypothetical protein